MSESELKAILNGTAVTNGLFDLSTGSYVTDIKAKIVFDTTTYPNASTLFKIKDNKAVTFNLTQA